MTAPLIRKKKENTDAGFVLRTVSPTNENSNGSNPFSGVPVTAPVVRDTAIQQEGRNVFSGVPQVQQPAIESETGITQSVAPQIAAPVQSVMEAMEQTAPVVRNPVQIAEQELSDAQNKDYSLKKNQPLLNVEGREVGTYTERGKDRDKDFNWKDTLRSIGLGALMGVGTGGLGGAIGGALTGLGGGLIDRNFDDKLKNQMFGIPQARQNLGQAQANAEFNTKQRLQNAQAANFENRPMIEQQKLALKGEELQIRRSRSEFQNTNDAQKTALSAIMKRGFYKEGSDPAEDERLAKLGIILPDFDSRKREVREQAGKFYQRNPDTQQWEETNMPVDESEVPIDFIIGGKQMKLRPRDIAGIEASKERQQSQQTFTAEQNQLNRDQQIRLKAIEQEQRIQLETIKNANDAIQKATDAATRAQAEEAKRQAAQKYNDLRNERLTLQNQKLAEQ